jgi:hypothetical protein
MNTATNVRKPRQVTRTVRLKLAPSEGGPGIINIVAGKVDQDYFVMPFLTDFGRGFLLEKTGGMKDDRYHINLNGGHSTCECDGFLHHGMCKDGKGCKHIASLAALVAQGEL